MDGSLKMKRSEMEEHIAAEVLEAIKSYNMRRGDPSGIPLRYAKGILDMILGFNMLPPAYYIILKKGMSGLSDEDPWVDLINEWEPE